MPNEKFRVMSITQHNIPEHQYIVGFSPKLSKAIKEAKEHKSPSWIELPSARATKTVGKEVHFGILIPVNRT